MKVIARKTPGTEKKKSVAQKNKMDFSHPFHEVEDIDLSKCHHTIASIKKKYAYQGDLELLINRLISEYAPFYLKQQHANPRPAAQRKLIEKIIKQMHDLNESLEWLSTGMQEDLYKLIENEKQRNAPCAEVSEHPKNFYEMLNQVTSHLEFLQPRFQVMANALFKKDTGGKKAGSLAKFLIGMLVDAYNKQTGKVASCAWNAECGESGAYQGNVYDFIVEINDNVLGYFNIKLGSQKTIGRYICDSIHSEVALRKIP